MLTHNLTLYPYIAESMQPALSFSSLEGNNMSTNPDYRFGIVATNRGGIALPNLVIQFAYTKPAARLHKRDSEKRFRDTIFNIKPVRKRYDGVYVITP